MNKYQLSQQLNEQLEKVAQANGITLDTLKYNIYRELEVAGWRDQIIWILESTYPELQVSEEDIDTILEQLEDSILYSDGIEDAAKEIINNLFEI